MAGKSAPEGQHLLGRTKRNKTGQNRTWTELLTCEKTTQTCPHKRESQKGRYLWKQGFPTLPCVRGYQARGVEGAVAKLQVANARPGY